MSYEDKSLQSRPPWAIGCDHPLDGHTRHGPWCEGNDKPEHCPDPDCDGPAGHDGPHYQWIPE